MTYTRATWDATIAAMNSGARIEVDEDIYENFLNVLPPVYMGRRVTLPGGDIRTADFGFAEGHDQVTAFWKERGRYFCQRTEEWNRG